jgi:hypothetical protein
MVNTALFSISVCTLNKKIVQALERGAPIHDLEAIRAYMKDIGDVLLLKEKEESGVA